MKISRIAIIGYGTFGKVLEQIVPVIFPDTIVDMVRRDVSRVAEADMIIPAIPVREFDNVITSLLPYLQRNQIIMDVCSVKQYPVEVMLKRLPHNVQILATHPMFGPGILKKTNGSLRSLKIMIDPVRVHPYIKSYLYKALKSQGITIIEMSACEHDKHAAQFHFTSQFFVAVLKDIPLKKTPIDTTSAIALHDFMELVQTDSISLLQDMLSFNPYCTDQLVKIHSSVENISKTIQS